MIVRKSKEGYVAHSGPYSLCIDTVEEVCTYKVAIRNEGDEYDYCPLGRKCKNPIEGWRDLLPFSILITPSGTVLTDGKTSLGLFRIPEAVHVDMVLTEGPYEGGEKVPVQDVRMMQDGDHVDPLRGTVIRGESLHYMKLEDRWFELIAKGEKIVEGRLYDEKRKKLRVGDVIQFRNVNNNAIIYTKITKLVIYNNFKEMLEREGTSRVLPGMDVDEGVKVYEKFYGPEAGPVLAIGLELL